MPTWPLTPATTSTTLPDISTTVPGQPNFLGFGILVPFQRDQKSDFATGGDVALIKSNIKQVLGTKARSAVGGGELPWRTDFGSWLHLLRHRQNDVVLQEMARAYVIDALKQWEPRAQVTAVSIFSVGRTLMLRIRFNIIIQSGNVLAQDQEVELPLLSLSG